MVVPIFASWHEAHERSLSVMKDSPRLPAHVFIETFSVLTRLPPPHRAEGSTVQRILEINFPSAPLSLPGSAHKSLIHEAQQAGISGGAIYDALVAATCRHCKATLLTRDRRAVPTYDIIGVDYHLLD